jgi:RHS repeat-associated protein
VIIKKNISYFDAKGSDIMTWYVYGKDSFNFDLVGNILRILHRVTDCGINGSVLGNDALNQNFEYDPIYRLTYADGRESDTQSGNNYLYNDAPIPGTPNANNVRAYNRVYSYDKLGNIQSVIQGGVNGFTRNYTYNNGKNTLQKIENATPATIENYTYDNCGNTLNTNLNRHYIWNHVDQLICYKNHVGLSNPTIYTQYDYSGQKRVSKLVRTGTDVAPIYERTIYIDDIFEYHILENDTTYEKNYIQIMDGKSRVAEIRIGDIFPDDIVDNITCNLEDQIGSSCVRLNTSGTVIDKEEYYPFGDSSLRTFSKKRYRYVGKEKDLESGLYYYGARYYAAWACRFISVDPLSSKYAQLSPYNYADNNPINDYDIDGMQNNNSANSEGSNPSNSPAKSSENKNNGSVNVVIHQVKSGETLSKIAKEYNTTVDALAKTNNISDPDKIQTGQKLNVGSITPIVQNNLTAKINFSFQTIQQDNTTVVKQPLVFTSSKSNAYTWKNFSSDASKVNWGLSLGATALENTSGSFRLGTTKLGFSPKYYSNAWTGNQYAKTFNIGKIGKLFSRGLVGVGIGIDYISYKRGELSGAKFSLNTGVGLYGLTGIGTIPAMLYFGVDAFYPGGWLGDGKNPGAIKATSNLIEQNKAIVPNFNLYRDTPGGW